jgi:hypothetical protein
MNTVKAGTRGRWSPFGVRHGDSAKPKTPGYLKNFIREIRARRRVLRHRGGRWSPYPRLAGLVAV